MTLISLPHRPLKAAVSNQQGAACRPAQTPSGREQAWPVCLAPPPAFFFFFPFFFLPNRFSQSVGRGSVAAGRIRNSGIHSMLSESPSGKTENFRHSGKQGQMLRSLTLGWYRKKNDLTLLSEAPGGGGAANERERSLGIMKGKGESVLTWSGFLKRMGKRRPAVRNVKGNWACL